ncbi:MAG: PEGA domain-containing protein [Methanoregula sp.]|jgi:hypothetical protein|nr:PEGA domain-containing protein [Methanoregula sp.]
MKTSIVPVCVVISLFFFLLPSASAACPLGYTPMTTTTTYPYGPYGTIYVESSPPGAIIYVNGANHGHSPATITNLYPGTYTIKAELAGFEDFTTTTTISGPTRSPVYFTMVPDNTGNGLYVVSTPSKADVYLDGVPKGVTPLMLISTTPGSHAILVRLSGYDDWNSTVIVPQGGTRTVAAILKEDDNRVIRGITVSSKPSGAKVLLDSVEKGVTPAVLNNIAAGIHILEVEYPGYNPWKSTVNVPETGIKEVSVNLTPEPANVPGWITVFSNPGNASVTLDGNYVGKTPKNSSLNLEGIPPGEHIIVLVLPGFRPLSQTIRVSPNLVSTVNATLMPVAGPEVQGALSVISDPAGAMVFVDNQSLGVSPVTVNDIAAGNHKVIIQKEGYEEYSVSILVAAGTTRNVTATLMPVTPGLHSPMHPLTALCALGIIGFCILRKQR